MKRPGWFGPKRLGFGIGPRTWQGWAVLGLFVLVVYGARWRFDLTPGQFWAVTGVALAVVLAIVFLTYESDED